MVEIPRPKIAQESGRRLGQGKAPAETRVGAGLVDHREAALGAQSSLLSTKLARQHLISRICIVFRIRARSRLGPGLDRRGDLWNRTSMTRW